MTWIRERALTIVLMAMFLLSLIGQILTGWHDTNASRLAHGNVEVDLRGYLASGHPWESLFENWESEFLQMAIFVTADAVPLPERLTGVEGPRREDPVDADPRPCRQFERRRGR